MHFKFARSFTLMAFFAFAGGLFLPSSASCQSATKTAETETSKTETTESDVKTKKPSEHFMRIRRDYRNRQVALETSITRYELKNKKGKRVTVDLIGAVHIGEKDYYAELNRRFEAYDSLLYELVAPEGTVIPKGGGDRSGVPTHPLAAMQKGMQAALGLEFQLELIDYTKKNFKHADMSPEEFAESMTNNDESIAKYALKAIGQGIAMQSAGKTNDSIGMLMAAFSGNKKYRVRRMFAKQIKQMEAGMVVFRGKDGSTIITHRNKKCLDVMQDEIDDGKTNLAIFYGAGHLPDMEERLLKYFDAKRGGQVWLEAWRLRDK